MRTIRIGNDVRLSITLNGIEDYNNISIKHAKCYLKKIGDSKEGSWCGFPLYVSDDYNLNMCGLLTHKVHPSNCTCKYQLPKAFQGCSTVKHRHFDFLMPHKILNEKNKLECYFPAEEQRYCGIYKLIIVLTMYQYGWGPDNLRTYTMDYGNVFELVDDETGESGNLTITVDTGYNDTNNGGGDQPDPGVTPDPGVQPNPDDRYCTISFIPGSDSSPVNQIKHLKGDRYTLPQCWFAPPSGYTFDKWQVNTDKIQNGMYNAGDVITIYSDASLTATWKFKPTSSSGLEELQSQVDELNKKMSKLNLGENEEFVKIKTDGHIVTPDGPAPIL